MQAGEEPGKARDRQARSIGLWLAVALAAAAALYPMEGLHADEPARYRYPAAFACDDPPADGTDAPEPHRRTLIMVANPHDHPVALDVTVRPDVATMLVRTVGPGDRVSVDCADLDTGTGTTGFVDVAAAAPVDVVAIYETSSLAGASSRRPLASVTFHVQLERQPQSSLERTALAELGIMLGKPVPLVTLTEIGADELLRPMETARQALSEELAARLEQGGLPADEAVDEATRIVADAMRMWVEVDDTDIALADGDLTIDVVPISAAPANDDTAPPVGSTTTAAPTTTAASCCTPSCCAAPAIILRTDSGFDWRALAAGFLLSLLALLLLGLLLLGIWWLMRIIGGKRIWWVPPEHETRVTPHYEITSRIVGEREVDVDDRAATLEIFVEAVGRLPDVQRLVEARLTLVFQFAGKHIAFDGKAGGTLELELPDLYWRTPVKKRVTVSTGHFADPERELPSAAPGTYWFDAMVSAKPEPPHPSIETVVGERRLAFDIAPD